MTRSPTHQRLATAALVWAALTLAVGCTAPGPGTTTPDGRPGPPHTVAPPTAEPVTLTIERLGILNHPLHPVGLDPDGTIEEPPVTAPDQTGWYSLGVKPGDPGPAVIVGHVSGRPPGSPRAVPGIFAKLDQLATGDEITIDRETGPPARFVVYDRTTAPKDRFPTDTVYGDTPGPELRLITCGGEFRPAVRSYASNIIVWARAL